MIVAEPFALQYSPVVPRKKSRWNLIKSGAAAARLLDGDRATLELLAEVAGIDVSVMCRRVQEAREKMAVDPGLKAGYRGTDLAYFQARYGRSDDPQVQEWLRGLNTRKRRRA